MAASERLTEQAKVVVERLQPVHGVQGSILQKIKSTTKGTKVHEA